MHTIREEPISSGARWRATWMAGPAAGRSVVLHTSTSYLIGRSRFADVRCLDRDVSAFHARVSIDAAGGVSVVQLAQRCDAARSPAWLDAVVDGVVSSQLDPTWPGPVHLDIGSSMLELVQASPYDGTGDGTDERPGERTDDDPQQSDLPRSMVHRAPRPRPRWDPVPIPVPVAADLTPAHHGGVVPALLGVAGAGLIAVVMNQPMFLLFAAMGAIVALGTWATQRIGALRRRRRASASARTSIEQFAHDLDAQRRQHLEVHVATCSSLAASIDDLHGCGAGLWGRRADHADAFVVSAGLGDVRWDPVLAAHASLPDACWSSIEAAGVHHDTSIAVELTAGRLVAVCGADAAAVARSLVVQLATQAGPADWRLIIVSDDPTRWAWTTGLPQAVDHLHADGSRSAIGDETDVAALLRDGSARLDRHVVVLTDDVAALAVRTSALRRLLGSEWAPAAIVVCGTSAAAPAVCTSLIEADGGVGRWFADRASGRLPEPLRYAGLHEADAAACSRRLGRLEDPEDTDRDSGRLPAAISLSALLAHGAAPGGGAGAGPATGAGQLACHGPAVAPPTSSAIAAAWRASPVDVAPAAPIGVAVDGVIDIDLVRDGPHALLAGTTGSGKSELLRALVLGLAVRLSPEQLTFVLVDYKGGATFDTCSALPHVVGLVTDLDDRLAERALRSLTAELQRRERVLRSHGVADLTALRRSTGQALLPRLLVIIDEFAALAVEHPSFLQALVGVAQRGRSLGVHLLLATQRPNGVISDDIRANTNLRLALRLQDVADAMDVVGDPAPAALPRDVPGRAIMRLGAGEHVGFQTAHVGGELADGRSEAQHLAAAIAGAAVLLGLPPAHRPWLEALPAVLDPATLATAAALTGSSADEPAAGHLGLVDLPDEQAQRPLRWRRDDGNLVVVGARGSGVTSTLRTVAIAALADGADLYVIDAIGDEMWDEVADHPNCCGVVRLAERERLLRLLRRVAPGPTASDGTSDGTRDGTSDGIADIGDWSSTTRIVVVVDGVGALRAELDGIDRIEEADAFARLIAGTTPARVAAAIGATDAMSLPSWLLARCAHRWLLHVHDPQEAIALGMRAADVPPSVPGRAAVLGIDASHSALDAQIVRPERGLPTTDAQRRTPRRPRLEVLPARVGAQSLLGDAAPISEGADGADGWLLPVGIGFDSLDVAELLIPDGEHLLVLGPARSGRSAVLTRVLHAWTSAGRGWCGVLAPRRTSLRPHLSSADVVALDLAELVDAVPEHGPALLVVDDAELVDDVDGRFTALISQRRPGLVVVAAGRAEGLRAAYGHWTSAIRRSRRGVILTGSHEHDGDLLGVSLPRRIPVAPRPGLGHLVDDGGCRLVQLAIDPVPAAPAAAEPAAAAVVDVHVDQSHDVEVNVTSCTTVVRSDDRRVVAASRRRSQRVTNW